MSQFTFAIGSEQSRSPPLNSEKIVNAFIEKQPPDSKTKAPLFGAPGLRLTGTAGTGPIRGFVLLSDLLYIVSGADLYRQEANGSITHLGTGIVGTRPVSLASNGTQIVIVDGTNGWLWSVATGFVQIVDVNFHASDTVVFFDGYFIFNWVGTAKFFFSGLFDGQSYSGLDVGTTESSAEPITGIAINLQLIFFFKGNSIELWYDAGTASFPFQRYAGGVINIGTNSPRSIQAQDNALFFLGQDRVFYRLQGNTPIRVSTHAMEHLISEEPDHQNVSGFTYTIEGHKFVGLTLPTALTTIVFDISSGEWHQRESFSALGVSLGIWRGWQTIDALFGPATIGDAFDGSLWDNDFDVFTEGANPMVETIVSAVLQEDRKRIFVARFELDVETGVGNLADPDPLIDLWVSKDGGRTFTFVASRSMGAAGDNTIRLRWLRLGQARQWMFKLICSAPVRRNIIGAYLTLKVGMG